MSGQPPDANSWLAWIGSGMGIAGTIAGIAKLFFVTRSELAKFMDRQDKKFLEALAEQRRELERALERQGKEQTSERLRLHQENRETSEGVFERISELEKGVSRIAGRLDERFQRGDRRN